MAITILKAGENPNETYIHQCSTCGTIFKYKYSDVSSEMVSSWHEMHGTCPVCDHLFQFSGHPIKELDLNLVDCKLVKFDTNMIIPEGVDAYLVTLNGIHIELLPLDTLIPSNQAIYLVGEASKIETAPGIQLPSTDKVYKLNLEKAEHPGYYTINSELKLVKETNRENFGIPGSLLSPNIDIVNVTIKD